MWTAIFCALSAVAAMFSLILSTYAVRSAARAAESRPMNLRSVESRQQSMQALLDEHSQLLTDLANSLKMIKTRNAARLGSKSDNGLPDPYREPDAWRKAANAKLALNKLNGG